MSRVARFRFCSVLTDDNDIIFSMSWLPHEGHAEGGDEFSTKRSNSSPHPEQRYSKIGIAPFRWLLSDPRRWADLTAGA